MSYLISKDFTFSASHQLRGLGEDHPCSRLHGHNYRARVELTGTLLDATGMVLDYARLGPFGAWIDTTLDHRHLNDLSAFAGHRADNPTAENLSRFLCSALAATVAIPASVLCRVWVSETPKTWAVWTAGTGADW